MTVHPYVLCDLGSRPSPLRGITDLGQLGSTSPISNVESRSGNGVVASGFAPRPPCSLGAATTGKGGGLSERTLRTRPGRRDHVERERHHGGPSAGPPALAPTPTLRVGMRKRLLVRVLRRVRPRDPHLSADLRADGRPPAHDLRGIRHKAPIFFGRRRLRNLVRPRREAEPTTFRRLTDPRRVASPCRPR